MRNVAAILNQLPPQIQAQLAAAFHIEQQEVIRSMGQAEGLQQMGRAQGKHEILQTLSQAVAGSQSAAGNTTVSGLGQVVANPARNFAGQPTP